MLGVFVLNGLLNALYSPLIPPAPMSLNVDRAGAMGNSTISNFEETPSRVRLPVKPDLFAFGKNSIWRGFGAAALNRWSPCCRLVHRKLQVLIHVL